jgi:cytochrome c oxidase assembly protein subunit 11
METRQANRKLALRLLVVSLGMFAFGVFALPPLYDKFCEITGIGQAGVRISDTAPIPSKDPLIGSKRTVKLLFDANTNSALPWEFKPVHRSMQVTLGEASVSSYTVSSLASVDTAGQAVFNVTPPAAAQYFVKTECFCFSRQQLAAGENREMPVRFYIEDSLPLEITEMTLSYTFFLNEDPAESVAINNTAGTGIN